MTASQTGMYFGEFGKLRERLKIRGLNTKQIDEYRHALTRKALGRDKSSKDFTNADFDAVLAAITAELKPADFEAQMRLQDMPEKRVSLYVNRIQSLSRVIGLNPSGETAYVRGISKRMFGEDQFQKLPERALQQLEGVLRQRLHQLHKTEEQIAVIEQAVLADAAKVMAIVGPAIEKQVDEEKEPF